jgi:hypothetical protein
MVKLSGPRQYSTLVEIHQSRAAIADLFMAAYFGLVRTRTQADRFLQDRTESPDQQMMGPSAQEKFRGNGRWSASGPAGRCDGRSGMAMKLLLASIGSSARAEMTNEDFEQDADYKKLKIIRVWQVVVSPAPRPRYCNTRHCIIR